MKTNFDNMTVANCKTTNPFIKPEWLEQLANTAFLGRCQNGQISCGELAAFIQQHQLYSRNFTRYLAALLANIEDDDQRLALTENLFDEMGFGDAGNVPHSKLYRNMMANMGLPLASAPLPSTQRLVDTMFHCCKSPNYMVGLGAMCLGAEGIVPFLYQRIVDGFLSQGVSLADLLFFTIHIDCDDGHADTMNAIIAEELKKSPNALIDLYYGAEKIIQARVDFFNGLSFHCADNQQHAA